MRRIAGTTALCALALALAASSAARALTREAADAAIAALDPKAAKKLVDRICDDDFAGRRSGTETALAAAGEIASALKAAGVAGAEVVRVGDFAHVVGTVAGSDKAGETILVSAHYDGPGEVDGRRISAADESASGTAALVEIARGLCAAKARPRRSVAFAAFSGYWNDDDAKRFQAAKAWARDNKKKIVFHIDVAMVGVGLFPKEPGRLFVLGAESGQGGDDVVKAAAAAEPELKLTRASMYLVEGRGPRDNYHTLRELEIPFVYVTSGVTRFYHKPEDAPGTIDPVRIEKAARLATRILAEVDARDAAPAFRKDPPTDDLSDAREVLAIVEAALDSSSGLDMTKASRDALAWKRDQVRAMVERGTLAAKDKAYLQRTLEALLYVLMK